MIFLPAHLCFNTSLPVLPRSGLPAAYDAGETVQSLFSKTGRVFAHAECRFRVAEDSKNLILHNSSHFLPVCFRHFSSVAFRLD